MWCCTEMKDDYKRWIGKDVEGSCRGLFQDIFMTCLEELQKIVYAVRTAGLQSRESNPGPRKQLIRVITIQPRRLVGRGRKRALLNSRQFNIVMNDKLRRWITLPGITLSCYPIRSRGSSVSILSDYILDDRAIEVRSPAGAKDFSSNLCVQTGSGAHTASCTMDTGGPFPGAKRVRGVTLTTHPHLVPRSIYSRGQEWVGAISPLPQAPSWCVAGPLCYPIICRERPRTTTKSLRQYRLE
jgi:hypothetical protein